LLSGWPVSCDLPIDDRPDDPTGDWAESGVVALTGRPDGSPLVPPGIGATAARGAELAFRALSRSPQVPSGWNRLLGERAALTGMTRRAPWSLGGTCRAVRSADGWVTINLARETDVATVAALLETDIAHCDAELGWQSIEAWSTRHCSSEIVARAVLLGLPCGEVPDHPVAPARPPIRRLEVASARPPPRGAQPLVLDLSALWAGPLCAHLLGLAGATVVKVETSTRLDGARRGEPRFFDLLNGGHDSVLVDLSANADRQLLAQLCDRADIVVSACRPRAWLSLGLDPYDVCRRSATTWVAITGYGLDEGERVGFGDDVAMAAGAVVREAADATPLPCGDALADPLTGMHAGVAALASYRSGGSRLLDVSMSAVVAATIESGTSSGGGPRSVDAPVARMPTGAAPAAGRDTERWRDQLR